MQCSRRGIRAQGPRLPRLDAAPDPVDAAPNTTVYLCEDKLSGEPVGTMRIQSTADGGTSGNREVRRHSQGPEALWPGRDLALSAVLDADPFVRLALWKAGYLHCMATRVRWLMLGVRKPGLLKAYEEMGAEDITDPAPLPYAGNLPHRILGLDVLSAESKWRDKNHPLLQFMVFTTHPDIQMPLMHRAPRFTEDVGLSVLQ